MDLQTENPHQEMAQWLRYRTQVELNELRAMGWDGRTVETIPFIGQILSPVEGIWIPSEDNVLRIESIGMPKTLKSRIASLLHKEYAGILSLPPLVKPAEFLALNAELKPELARDIPEYIFGIAQLVQADMFFGLLRVHMKTGLKLDVPAGYENPELEARLSELLARITDDNCYVIDEKLEKVRLEYGILEELEDIEKFIRLVKALNVDLSILSIKDQHKLYVAFQTILYEVDFYNWISVAQWTFSHKPAVEINVPMAIHPILTEALRARYKLLRQNIMEGIDQPQIVLCDEDFVSANMYLKAQLACGRLQAYEDIEQDMAALQPYLAELRAHAIEEKCLNAVMFFFVQPDVSLQRADGKTGSIINSIFLQHLWIQQLRIYYTLLHPNRTIAVIAIDASGTPESTANQVFAAVFRFTKMAGIKTC